jgi:hypothetical protein
LPHLFVARTVAGNAICIGSTREREAATHYSNYTRELCMSYFLRKGDILTYVEHLVKQQVYELLLFSGTIVVIRDAPTVV